MKTPIALLYSLFFCVVLQGQEVSYSPLPDSCFDAFTFHLPKPATDAAAIKFTRQRDSLLEAPSPDALALAIVYRRLGILYYNLTDREKSYSYTYKSLQKLKSLLPIPEAEYAKSLQAHTYSLFLNGKYDSVMICLDAAIDINRRLYGKASVGLGTNLRIKGTAYNNLTRYQEALPFLNQAADIESQIYRIPHPNFAKTLYVRGLVKLNLKDFAAALQDLKYSEQIILQTFGVAHPALGNIYHIIGVAYQGIGDYDNALIYLQRSLFIREQALGIKHTEVGYLYLFIGEYYLETGDFTNAVFYMEHGMEILVKAGGAAFDKIARMVSLYAEVGDYEKEAQAFEKMLEASKIDSWGTTNDYVIIGYNSHAFALIKQNRGEEALDWLDKAFKLNQQLNPDKPRQNHDVLLLKAKALTQLHRFDEVISTFEQVLKTEPVLAKKKQAQAGLAATYFEKFKTQRQPADLQIAWKNNLAALLTLDSMRFSAQSSASRIQQSDLNFHLFEGTLATCHARQDITSAFWIAEKSKAQALLENQRDDVARRITGLPDSLLRLESGLKGQIAELEKTIYEKPTDDAKKVAEAGLFEKKQNLSALLLNFEKNYPLYFRLKYSTALAGVAEVQASLPEATALLEYFVGDSSIYVFTLTKTNLQLKHLPKPKDFESSIQSLRQALTNAELRFLKKDLPLFSNAAGKLYDWLLAAPLAALPSGIKRLVIVPDGALCYLPFEILGKTNTPSDFKTYPYLLKNFSISYAASANLLLEQTKQAATRLPGQATSTSLDLFAGFAPSYHSSDTLSAINSRTRSLLVRDEDYEIPGAALEVQEIAKLLGGKTWLGEAATKNQFKQQSPNFRILHLAMHSIMDDANPLFSRLLFTQLKTTTDDNDLYANDLYNLRLPAQLVVLSACNTGNGQLRRGEGVMSLSRAFTFTGVPTTVMSLWKAPDEVTRQLMLGFYQNLKMGLRKDEALQQAKLAQLRNADPGLSSPFFWACFVANGDMEALFER